VIRWLWAFVDRPLARFEESAAFWCAVTDTTLSARRGVWHEFATLEPEGADACLKVQGVFEGGGGVHLDIDVDDVDSVTHAAVEEHGAILVRRDGVDLSVLRSPAGQLFCVTRDEGRRRRPPVVAGPEGARSRVDQICFDISPEHFEREAEFWGAFTGWGTRQAKSPEFTRVEVPDTLPVRILLQRRDTPAPPAAHIDVACGSDVAAVRARHEALGARWVADGPDWQVMRDPAGGLYCLTPRDPDTGTLQD